MTAFNMVLRTSALAGKVDHQRTSLAFAAVLQNLPDDGNVVPLGPIYDFLLQQKAPEAAVREIVVYLKSREGRFGVTMQMPAQLQSMSDEERGRILLAVAARGQSGGTFPGMTKSAPEPEPPPPAHDKADAPGGFVPEKKAKGDATNAHKRLVVALVVCVAGLVVNLVYAHATKAPAPQLLALNDANGLPCVELLDVPAAFICSVHEDFLAATPRDDVKARAEVTRADAVARGLPSRPVQVLSFEKRELRYVFP